MTRHRFLRTLLGLAVAGLGLGSLGACAYNATGVAAVPTLIFSFSVQGTSLKQATNLAYYFVVNTDTGPSNTKPNNAPLVNGSAPLTFPYPDPRSYLPFVRDDVHDLLDQQPVAAPPTYWTDFFELYDDGSGQFVLWQGRQNPDGSVNEKYQQLQSGRQWGFPTPNTLQITIPFNMLSWPSYVDLNNPATLPAQINCNLAVATRALGSGQTGYVIDRWGQVQNQFFSIPTTPVNQNIYNSIAGVLNPQYLGGIDPSQVNITAATYRVVSGS